MPGVRGKGFYAKELKFINIFGKFKLVSSLLDEELEFTLQDEKKVTTCVPLLIEEITLGELKESSGLQKLKI